MSRDVITNNPPLDCPPLHPGEGALASNRDTAFGTTVTFSCLLGQEFATGKAKISTTCLPGGNWSVTYIPKCQEVYCGPVPQIDNGFSIGSTNVTYRGLATYQCYAGFAFPSSKPVEKISCLSDGRWEKKPSCLGKFTTSLSFFFFEDFYVESGEKSFKSKDMKNCFVNCFNCI